MAELKLLPCPFCGGLELTKECEPGFDGKSWYFVSCLCVQGPERETPEEAIEAWNTRPEPNTRALDERVKELRDWVNSDEAGMHKFACSIGRVRHFARAVLDAKINELFPAELKEKESEDG